MESIFFVRTCRSFKHSCVWIVAHKVTQYPNFNTVSKELKRTLLSQTLPHAVKTFFNTFQRLVPYVNQRFMKSKLLLTVVFRSIQASCITSSFFGFQTLFSMCVVDSVKEKSSKLFKKIVIYFLLLNVSFSKVAWKMCIFSASPLEPESMRKCLTASESQKSF